MRDFPYRLGDLIFTRGTNLFSNAIDRFSPEIEEGFSHVALAVSERLAIEAVLPRVRTAIIAHIVAGSPRVMVARPLFLSGKEDQLLEAAYKFHGNLYGMVTKFPGLILDSLCRTDWIAPYFSPWRSHPVCSQLVGAAYESLKYSFGEDVWGLSPDEAAYWCQQHLRDWEHEFL